MTPLSRTSHGESTRRYSFSEYVQAFSNRANKKLNEKLKQGKEPASTSDQLKPERSSSPRKMIKARKQPYVSGAQSVAPRQRNNGTRRIYVSSAQSVATRQTQSSRRTVARQAKPTVIARTKPPCSCCSAKQEKIDQQEQELQQMKTLVEGMVKAMAEKARTTEKAKPVAGIECIENIALADKHNDDDTNSVGSTVSVTTTTSSLASLSPSTSRNSVHISSSASVRRISSLPLTTVSEEQSKRIKQEIQISGQKASYSGPPIKKSACTLMGCVVRMENKELYVGSVRKNDTGSFTFCAPGTLYGKDGLPKRRIRK